MYKVSFCYWHDNRKNNCVVVSLNFLLQLPLSQWNHGFYNTIFNHVGFIRNANIKSQRYQNYLTPAYPLQNNRGCVAFCHFWSYHEGCVGTVACWWTAGFRGLKSLSCSTYQFLLSLWPISCCRPDDHWSQSYQNLHSQPHTVTQAATQRKRRTLITSRESIEVKCSQVIRRGWVMSSYCLCF